MPPVEEVLELLLELSRLALPSAAFEEELAVRWPCIALCACSCTVDAEPLLRSFEVIARGDTAFVSSPLVFQFTKSCFEEWADSD
jgi:hypothetical protein